jgi:hypothetical protein
VEISVSDRYEFWKAMAEVNSTWKSINVMFMFGREILTHTTIQPKSLISVFSRARD